jgi:Flp pilus assembly protein TadG
MKLKIRALFPHRTQRGQSLVELAISLTVMLMLLAGAVTFGMALFSYVALRDAAQEGALYGSFSPADPAGVQPVNPEICDRVQRASSSPVDLSTFHCELNQTTPIGSGNHIDVFATNGAACEGTSAGGTPNGIQVMVEYDYPIIMPYVGGILGSQTIHLTAQVTDTILEPRCSP